MTQVLAPVRARRSYRPCPKLPGRRIRLQSTLDGRVCLLKCKGWCCSGCGPWMKDRFIKVASAEARRCFRRGRFLTLTLGPEARDLDTRDRFKLMSQVWKRFVQRVGRLPTHLVKCKPDRLAPLCREACGERHVPVTRPLQAIWVREVHLDGTPHLHVLVDRFIEQRWASTAWAACGGGSVVDIRAVKLSRVVAYVTKYLAKSLGVRLPERMSDGLKGVRRYGSTGPPDAKPSMKGVYPQKRSSEPWRLWFKPGLKVPMDWRPVPQGEERLAIAWVSSNFGENRRMAPEAVARMAASLKLRFEANERERQRALAEAAEVEAREWRSWRAVEVASQRAEAFRRADYVARTGARSKTGRPEVVA